MVRQHHAYVVQHMNNQPPPEGTVSATLQQREWRMTVDVSAPCPGKFQDWPANIQDGIHQAIDRQCQPRRLGHEMVIVFSGCFPDPDKPGGWFLQVQVEELPTNVVNQAVHRSLI